MIKAHPLPPFPPRSDIFQLPPGACSSPGRTSSTRAHLWLKSQGPGLGVSAGSLVTLPLLPGLKAGSSLPDDLDQAEKANAAERGWLEINHVIDIIQPYSLLLKPEAPPGLLLGGLKSPAATGKVREEGDQGSFRGLAESFRFLRNRSSSLSAAIAKTLSAKVTAMDDDEDEVTEIDLQELKVLVRTKAKEEEDDWWKLEEETALKGRISFC